MRRPHPAEAADGHLLPPRGKGERAVLRPQARASETPWSRDLWIYDLRTNRRFTLKANPLRRADLDDFVERFNPDNRLARQETERFRRFGYDELVKRDKANLDIFWLRDESMEDTANLPPPGVIAEEILEDLRARWAS